MELFVHIEELDFKNRSAFEQLFKLCTKEIDLPLDSVIPYFIYQIGNNDGVMAFDIYGKPVGYLLYNKHNNYYVNLIHFWVTPELRRNNIATRMVSNIIIKEQPYVISSYVNEYFLSAQLFLKSLNFKCIRIVRMDYDFDKYYFVTKDDGKIDRFSLTTDS